MDRVAEAGFVLVGFLLGLCFFSLNKILLSLFYSFHDTKYPTIISVIATLFNIAGNYFLVDIWGSFGLAVATSLSGLLQTILCFYFLQTQHNLSLKNSELLLFCRNYGAQVIAVLIPLYGIYSFCFKTIAKTAYGTFFYTIIWFLGMGLAANFIVLRSFVFT
jgi:putative peptidoglycan lipid II flippase